MSTNLYTDTERLSLSEVRHNWQHWQNTRRSTGKVPDELWQQAYDLLDDHDQWSVCKALGISYVSLVLEVKMADDANENILLCYCRQEQIN